MRTIFQTVLPAVTVPWSGFVGAFIYYVGVTLVAIGGGEPSDAVMATAYLAPVALYGLVLLARAVRALAALPLPHARRAHPRHA